MKTRHMLALLLGVAPIVAVGQIAIAQPANGSADATAPDNITASAANESATDVPAPIGDAADTANSTDDAPPK